MVESGSRCASVFFSADFYDPPSSFRHFLVLCAWFDFQAIFYLLRLEFQRIHDVNYMGSVIVPLFYAAFSQFYFFPSIYNPFARLQCFTLSVLLLPLTAWGLSLHSGLTLEPQFIPRPCSSTYSVLHYHSFLLAVKRYLPHFYIPSIHLPPIFTPAVRPSSAYPSHCCHRYHARLHRLLTPSMVRASSYETSTLPSWPESVYYPYVLNSRISLPALARLPPHLSVSCNDAVLPHETLDTTRFTHAHKSIWLTFPDFSRRSAVICRMYIVLCC